MLTKYYVIICLLVGMRIDDPASEKNNNQNFHDFVKRQTRTYDFFFAIFYIISGSVWKLKDVIVWLFCGSPALKIKLKNEIVAYLNWPHLNNWSDKMFLGY